MPRMVIVHVEVAEYVDGQKVNSKYGSCQVTDDTPEPVVTREAVEACAAIAASIAVQK